MSTTTEREPGRARDTLSHRVTDLGAFLCRAGLRIDGIRVDGDPTDLAFEQGVQAGYEKGQREGRSSV